MIFVVLIIIGLVIGQNAVYLKEEIESEDLSWALMRIVIIILGLTSAVLVSPWLWKV